MHRNFLSDTLGDAITALLAGAAFNLKMRQLKEALISIFEKFVIQLNKHRFGQILNLAG